MDSLATDPRIKPIGIDIEYPDRVTITIDERTPAAYIEKNGALIVIDNEGWVLDVLTPPTGTERPLINGLQADAFEVGQELSSGDMFRVDVMTRVLKAAEDAGIGLEDVDVTLAADIMLTTKDGLMVELGDDTQMDKKMALVNASVKEIASLGKSGGTLDVSSVDKAYFREKSS
jgi:cell division septal protein FtsQ